MNEYNLMVNGFDVKASYDEDTVLGIFLPLLGELTRMQRTSGKRLIAYLAAPPAAGKSTLAALLEMLSLEYMEFEPLQSVGIDGFHYHQDYILSHTVPRDGEEVPMKDVKGCPESYDVQKLRNTLKTLKERDVKWPYYDRRLHDAVEDVIDVNRKILLIEGNWLLLKEGEWADVRKLCDYSIMLRAKESDLESRLVERKMRGGSSRLAAQEYYDNSDKRNISQCLNESAEADLTLQLEANGTIRLIH